MRLQAFLWLRELRISNTPPASACGKSERGNASVRPLGSSEPVVGSLRFFGMVSVRTLTLAELHVRVLTSFIKLIKLSQIFYPLIYCTKSCTSARVRVRTQSKVSTERFMPVSLLSRACHVSRNLLEAGSQRAY